MDVMNKKTDAGLEAYIETDYEAEMRRLRHQKIRWRVLMYVLFISLLSYGVKIFFDRLDFQQRELEEALAEQETDIGSIGSRLRKTSRWRNIYFPGTLNLPNGETLELIRIQPDRRKEEAAPYWIGKTEVTQGQWAAVTGGSLAEQSRKNGCCGENTGVGAAHPIYFVSYEDALDFCRRLNDNPDIKRPEGYCFNLPTETQWEYAAFGGAPDDTIPANDPELAESGGERAVANGTREVAGGCANRLGIFDMNSNVWEWCRDWYIEGSCRVIRGGSWNSAAEERNVRSRSFFGPEFRLDDIGFRVVLAPDEKSDKTDAEPSSAISSNI